MLSDIYKIHDINNSIFKLADSINHFQNINNYQSALSNVGIASYLVEKSELVYKSFLNEPTFIDTINQFHNTYDYLDEIGSTIGIVSSYQSISEIGSRINKLHEMIPTSNLNTGMTKFGINIEFNKLAEAGSSIQNILSIYKPKFLELSESISKTYDFDTLSSIKSFAESNTALLNSFSTLNASLGEYDLSVELSDTANCHKEISEKALAQEPSTSISTTKKDIKKVICIFLDLLEIYSFINSTFFDKTNILLENQKIIIHNQNKISESQDNLSDDILELQEMVISLKEDNQIQSQQIDELTRSNQDLIVLVHQLSDDIHPHS